MLPGRQRKTVNSKSSVLFLEWENMSIIVNCSNCGKEFSVPDEWAGKKAKCSCGAIFEVPDYLEEIIEEPPAPQPQPPAQPAFPKPQATRATRAGSRSRSVAGRSPRGGRGTRVSSRQNLRCQECDGRTVPKKQFRRSTPLVVVGFIAIALAVSGLLTSLMIVLATDDASTAISEATQGLTEVEFTDFMDKVQDMGFPEEIKNKVGRMEELSESDLAALTPEQREFIKNSEEAKAVVQMGAEMAREMGDVGAEMTKGLGKILAVILLIPSLIALAAGVLLLLRKKVFVCVKCGTVEEG